MPDLASVNWRDEQQVAEVMRLWLESPRRQAEIQQPATRSNENGTWAACPNPTAGVHVFHPGHMFTPDGFCWIPEAST